MWEKKQSHLQPIQENNTTSLSDLARKIDIEQVLVRVIREDTCFYFDLGRRGDLVELGVSS